MTPFTPIEARERIRPALLRLIAASKREPEIDVSVQRADLEVLLLGYGGAMDTIREYRRAPKARRL